MAQSRRVSLPRNQADPDSGGSKSTPVSSPSASERGFHYLQRTAGNQAAEALAKQERLQAQTRTGDSTSDARGLLVSDETTELGSGQMRKSEFMAALRSAVCTSADGALASTDQTAEGCPWIEMALRFYGSRSPERIERDLLRYAPETANAMKAGEYIPIVAARVRASVEHWVATGEITGVPEGLPGTGLIGALSGSFLGETGGLFFKGRSGNPMPPTHPRAVQARLGEGRPLNSFVRSRMESVFGRSFSGVQLHTDATAARLARGYQARAFTVGEHVAFARGEYRPGTPIGDALIAHELAHVIQQSEATASSPVSSKGASVQAQAEQDADRSAAGAMASLWSSSRGSPPPNLGPTFRTGLQLQRCDSFSRNRPSVPVNMHQTSSAPCTVEQRQTMTHVNPCCTDSMLAEIAQRLGQAIPAVQNAIAKLADPQAVENPLWNHFRIRPDDRNRIDVIRRQFGLMLAAMQGRNVTYICSSRMTEEYCKATLFETPIAQTGPTCQGASPIYVQFCGDYEKAVDPNSSAPYLHVDNNWLKTLIHEYAHVACASSGSILPEGEEFYRSSGSSYPPNADLSIKNADSYAWFALEV